MTVNRFAPKTARAGLAATFALILVAGCETARTPVELVRPSAQPAPSHVSSVVSVAGGAEGRAGVLDAASRRIQSAPERLERVQRARLVEEHIVPSTSPPVAQTHPGPASSESADGDVALIEFGTEIRMPFGGPFTVTAYTIASRPTHITHVIRVTKTVGGRSYTSTFNDDSGFFNQPSLYSSVGISGDCETLTRLDAKTEHEAASLTFGREQGMSTAEGSCGTPGDSCGGDEGGPDDVTLQGAGDDAAVAGDCTGGGPAPGGETTRYTCYTTVTDYYWYYPDTGTYEYRYSEETTWCDEAT